MLKPKHLILLILALSTSVFAQKRELRGDYESLDTESWDAQEYENIVTCYDENGKVDGFYWGIKNDGCNAIFRSLIVKPTLINESIKSITKRNFKQWKEFIAYELPNIFSEYSSKFNWKNKFEVPYDEININFITGDSGRIIAQAHSPLDGDIRILINIDQWEKLNNYQKAWLFLHEYGHEAYGMKHGDNKLMYPLMPNEELLKTAEVDDELADLLYKKVLQENLRIASREKAERRAKIAVNKYYKEVAFDSKENFGQVSKYDFSGSSTKVPPALNVFFDAMLDFYNDLINRKNSKNSISYGYYSVNGNKKININANYYYAIKPNGTIYIAK